LEPAVSLYEMIDSARIKANAFANFTL
jgi:hypothetical protein